MTMSRRKIGQAVLVGLLVIVLAEFLFRRMISNAVPRQVMRTISEASQTIDVLGMGNSLMAGGFVPEAVEQTCRDAGHSCLVVNGAMGASGVIEQLALTRLAWSHHNVRTLIYGFFDGQMADDTPLKNSDLIGNHTMLYYQEPQLTLQYAHFDPINRFAFEVYRCCALLRERSFIWAKVEKLRRAIGAFGMPSEETNQFGRTADFSLLEATDPLTFARICLRTLQSRRLLSPPILELLWEARDHGTKVVVVEMPMHPSHRERFYAQPIWSTFREKSRTAVEEAGAIYVNASDWITDAHLFSDLLHLSKSGGTEFSFHLARHLLL
jgi:hypothetical protein